jgi:hypothetical protein
MHPLLDLRDVALDLAKDRGRIDLDTTLGHHLGQIAITDALLALPANASQDDLDWKAAAFEDRPAGGARTGRSALHFHD